MEVRKRTITKGQMLSDSIYMKCTEKENGTERQWLPGLGREENRSVPHLQQMNPEFLYAPSLHLSNISAMRSNFLMGRRFLFRDESVLELDSGDNCTTL